MWAKLAEMLRFTAQNGRSDRGPCDPVLQYWGARFGVPRSRADELELSRYSTISSAATSSD